MNEKYPLFCSVFQTIKKFGILFWVHIGSCYRIAGSMFEISLVRVHYSCLGVTCCFVL